jgi:hypothetical protein
MRRILDALPYLSICACRRSSELACTVQRDAFFNPPVHAGGFRTTAESIDGQKGATLEGVRPDSPLASCGVGNGDTLVTIDGRRHGVTRDRAGGILRDPRDSAEWNVVLFRERERLNVTIRFGDAKPASASMTPANPTLNLSYGFLLLVGRSFAG